MKIGRSVVIGVIIGIVFASAIVIFARFNDNWDNQALRSIINFFVSIPLFHFMTNFSKPDFMMKVLFFIYWALLGGVVSWLLNSKKTVSKIALVILIIALVISHRFVQLKIEGELDAALDAFKKLFTGEAYMEEIKK